jgi:hydroxymethylpyrimidine/phosphomethylpyrimidine kinase
VSGHDPGGGAGIQADIEAAAANGAHACTVISCLTDQDSCDVHRLLPQPPVQVLNQARRVLADSPIAALKIGLLGDARLAQGLGELLAKRPDLPVVLDPVLASGAGTALANRALEQALRELLPRVLLLTPNSLEARHLASAGDSLAACADRLLELGARAVLITGTHEDGDEVFNRLYRPHAAPEQWGCRRLAASYHGSGCTLATAIAARLAGGEPLAEAVRRGLDYTWHSLEAGWQSGRCQPIPDRLFALRRGSQP